MFTASDYQSDFTIQLWSAYLLAIWYYSKSISGINMIPLYRNIVNTSCKEIEIMSSQVNNINNQSENDTINIKAGSAANSAANRFSLVEFVVTALFIALVFVFTAFVNIRLPFALYGGLIHLGNVPLFICAILFGKRSGAIAGGVGMALFDLLSGWTLWAPFTLVIVSLMGFVVGLISEKKKGIGWYVLAMLTAIPIKIGGYYIAEGIIYSNWVSPITSIPGNLIQVGTAIVLVAIVIIPLRHAKNRIFNK